MRLREILNLKKEEVLLGDIGGTIVLGDTKNGESRKIPLTKELTDLFKRIIDNAWDESPIPLLQQKDPKANKRYKNIFSKVLQKGKHRKFEIPRPETHFLPQAGK